MKRIRAICRHFKLEMISSGAAFAILFAAFCFTGMISISGQKCVLTCDLYGQYYDFLVGIRRILLEHQSLVFSWDLDMGIGLIGWMAYYVISPFNLLLLLIPESFMIWGITFVILLKLSSSSFTFTYFLKKGCNLHGIETVLFALCYSLSSFMVTYYFNIMWLDILILLPLLVLNMKRIVEGENWIPFALWLSAAFFTNYYMSFMAGIFLFTCFLAYYIFKYGTIFSRCFAGRFVKFAGSAFVAFGICSVVLIPTILQMSERLGEGTVAKYEGIFNFDLADFFQSATIGSYTSLNKGQPLIYCSILVMILLPLYFFNHKIQKREKLCFGILLALWIVIMALPFTDLAMHMGNNPTCFPYRYTFVFIFLLCMAGAREFQYFLQNNAEKKILIISGIFLILFAVIEILDFADIKDVVNQSGFIFTAISVLVYGLLFWLLQHNKLVRKDFLTLITLVLISELMLNSVIIFKEMDREVGFKSADNILKRQELLLKQLDQIQDDEPGYRIEKNYRVSYNDGFAYGYNSISSFSSVYNLNVHRFMENMGIANQDWNSSYNGSTTFLDSILGIKYILHSIPIDSTVLTSGKTDYIEKNEYYLPIGFMVNDAIADYTLDDDGIYSPFEAQQKLLIAMTGEQESGDCFALFEPEEITYNNVICSADGEKLVYQKIDSNTEASIVYEFTGDGRKEYYFYPQFVYKEDATKYNEVLTRYKSGVDSHFVERSNLLVPYNIRLFDSPGATSDTVTFDILENEEIKLNDQIFYSFDKEKYQKYYKKFQEQSLNIISFQDGFFEGNVSVTDDNDMLFLSVPYNVQWEISVDGEPADVIRLCSGAFTGVKLSKGEHKIVAAYRQKFLEKSILLSCVSIILITVLLFRRK